jgi:hypothetical protein
MMEDGSIPQRSLDDAGAHPAILQELESVANKSEEIAES